MGLWGNKEFKLIGGSLGTSGATGVTITGIGTTFLTDVQAGDLIVQGATGIKMVVDKVTSNTSLTISSPTFIAAGATGIYVSQVPKYLTDDEKKTKVFGVDTVETAVNGKVAHGGWVKVTTGTGGRAGRVLRETLVAMGVTPAVMGDAEDTAFPDA
jgi:hypothetical protein